MQKENSAKLWKIIQEAGRLFKRKTARTPKSPKVGEIQPYAHIAICIKSKFKKSYKDIEDEKFNEVIDYIEYLKQNPE